MYGGPPRRDTTERSEVERRIFNEALHPFLDENVKQMHLAKNLGKWGVNLGRHTLPWNFGAQGMKIRHIVVAKTGEDLLEVHDELQRQEAQRMSAMPTENEMRMMRDPREMRMVSEMQREGMSFLDRRKNTRRPQPAIPQVHMLEEDQLSVVQKAILKRRQRPGLPIQREESRRMSTSRPRSTSPEGNEDVDLGDHKFWGEDSEEEIDLHKHLAENGITKGIITVHLTKGPNFELLSIYRRSTKKQKAKNYDRRNFQRRSKLA